MTPKLQILSAQRRLVLAEQVNDLLPSDKTKLIELILLEIAGQLEGIFPGVSSAVYHHPLCPGFSFSSINEAVRSATHWLLSSKWETPAMKLGTAFHTLALEPEKMTEQYPEGSLSKDTQETIAGMLEALKAHKAYDVIFGPSLERMVEVTVFAKCPVTGLLRKVRPDVLILKRALIDLKTTGADGIDDFGKRADTYHYEAQTAYYLDTCELAGLILPENYQWAIRRLKPYDVTVFSYDESYLNAGRMRYWLGLENIADLLKANQSFENKEVIRLSKRGKSV